MLDVIQLREAIEVEHPDGVAAGECLADAAISALGAGVERLRAFPGLGRPGPATGVQELVVPGPTRHLTFTVGYRAEPGQSVVLGITWGGGRFTDTGRA